LILIFSALIVLEDWGAPFYLDRRLAKKGKIIKIIKLRTMFKDSESLLNKYLKGHPHKRKEWKQYRKIRGHDPRMTIMGKLLRKYSLDELPQIVNILSGRLSFVGPRPYQPEEKIAMGNYGDIILSVKPGLTGLWQTAGRNELKFARRLEMDYQYITHWSLGLDLKIILKTIGVVVQGQGAY
jgi:lipopolysaccharide/colanic/teichoic acid biosynthesis glycosyltransferase